MIGVHVLGNLYGCPRQLLKKKQQVRLILKNTVKESKLHPLGEVFHQFKPEGVTGVIILEESHLSIHTWPEKNFAAVDIFTCGNEGNAQLAFKALCRHLQPCKITKKVIKR
jgi:S-adenosylmethionine decarboxylase